MAEQLRVLLINQGIPQAAEGPPSQSAPLMRRGNHHDAIHQGMRIKIELSCQAAPRALVRRHHFQWQIGDAIPNFLITVSRHQPRDETTHAVANQDSPLQGRIGSLGIIMFCQRRQLGPQLARRTNKRCAG